MNSPSLLLDFAWKVTLKTARSIAYILGIPAVTRLHAISVKERPCRCRRVKKIFWNIISRWFGEVNHLALNDSIIFFPPLRKIIIFSSFFSIRYLQMKLEFWSFSYVWFHVCDYTAEQVVFERSSPLFPIWKERMNVNIQVIALYSEG